MPHELGSICQFRLSTGHSTSNVFTALITNIVCLARRCVSTVEWRSQRNTIAKEKEGEISFRGLQSYNWRIPSLRRVSVNLALSSICSWNSVQGFLSSMMCFMQWWCMTVSNTLKNTRTAEASESAWSSLESLWSDCVCSRSLHHHRWPIHRY